MTWRKPCSIAWASSKLILDSRGGTTRKSEPGNVVNQEHADVLRLCELGFDHLSGTHQVRSPLLLACIARHHRGGPTSLTAALDAGGVHQYHPPTVRILEGQPLLCPVRVLRLDRFVPVAPQACGRLPERPFPLDVEYEEVVLRRGRTRAAALVVRELQVVAPAR